MHKWPLQHAKARFSELVQECLESGPQLVTRYGKDAVIIVPADTYRQLTGYRESLSEFFLTAPRVHLQVDRESDTGREVEL